MESTTNKKQACSAKSRPASITNIIECTMPSACGANTRPKLAAAHRGRFWQSVVVAREAAKATHPRGYEHGEVSHG